MKPTPFIPTVSIAQRIEEIVQNEQGQRKPFERRWYNNNFFDDGYHYRFVSRTTGRVVDLSTTSDTFIPYRAIPKASRQIRGIANLMMANEYRPVVYPENVKGFMLNSQEEYQKIMKVNKNIAKRVGQWIDKMWDDLDLKKLLTQMVLMTAKHGVSYIQVWPDPVEEKVNVSLYDAFDIILKGSLFSIYDSPYIIKVQPTQLSEILANEEFDEAQKAKLTPDNKYASSEIKEAYMMARFGTVRASQNAGSVLLKEGFVKEYINDENKDKVASDLGKDYKGKKTGDPIIRQVFECAGVWLKDTYLNLPEYPFVDFRMEPGPIYQVPLIERFIPANKTLDAVMSRVERHIGTMAVGAWLKRRGEQFQLNNMSGGQVIEYDQSPPVQAQVAGFPAEVFHFIGQLNSIIEEQGASTSALGNVPTGVKSGVAIESLKATEYANLKIATDQMKDTISKITEKFMDLASEYFITPQTVYSFDKGEPDYFDIIGQKGMEKYTELAGKKGAIIQAPNAIPIKKDYKVKVEIESGLGYTVEGKKNSMIQILDYMMKLAEAGYLTQEAVSLVIQRFLEIFQFGTISEFMDALETGTPPLTENQIKEVKIAVMEVIRDLQKAEQPQGPMPSTGMEGPAEGAEDQDILKVKTGVMEAFNDLKNSQGA